MERRLACRPGCWEVLFVCDGCTDGTPDLLADLAHSSPLRVRILTYSPNRGKGFAVRTGLAAARGRYRLFTDVDLAYGWDDLRRVVQALRAGAGVAVASRAHPQSRTVLAPGLLPYVAWRQLQSEIFGWLVRRLLPQPHRDTQAGLKGLTERAAHALLPYLACDGFGFDCELLTAAWRLGIRVQEVPVCVRYERTGSTTSWATGLRMLRELGQIRRDWCATALPRRQPRAEAQATEAA